MSLKNIHTLIIASSAAGLLSLSSCTNMAGAQAPATDSTKPIAETASATAETTSSATPKKKQDKFPVANPLLDAEGKPVKNVFISPYKPYNPIDTKGYRSGSVVGDPSTMTLNPKTGKTDKSTLKAFRIP